MSEGLVVVGSVAQDSIVTKNETCERVLGGSASYAAIAASFFCTPQIVAVIGNDFPFQYLEQFTERGIDLDGLKVDETKPTFFWRGEYSDDFSERKTLEIQLNAFEGFRPRLSLDQKHVGCVCLGNISPALQLSVIDQFDKKPFIVGDTIDLWIDRDRETLIEVMRRSDLWIVNESEACQLAGESCLYKAGHRLLELGCDRLIIKRGEHGSTLFMENHYFCLPAYPVLDVKDPTGAGDVFAGALTGFLSAHPGRKTFDLLKQGMLWGTSISSFVIEAFSCNRLFEINLTDIKKRNDQLLSMISVKNMLA